MNTGRLRSLSAEWRSEASVLRRRGAGPQADALESAAAELERRLDEWEEESLTIADAAEESGYSEDHLRELVRTGRLPDHRPPGSEGRILIRRRDLPRKPPERRALHDPVSEMLELMR